LAAWHAQLSRLQQADKVQSLSALVLDRIRADELTSPAGDSAQAYLSQLRAAAPSAPATPPMRAAGLPPRAPVGLRPAMSRSSSGSSRARRPKPRMRRRTVWSPSSTIA